MKTYSKKPPVGFILVTIVALFVFTKASKAISIFVSPVTYNTTQTDTNKIQFDVYVKNTGSDTLGYRTHTLRFTMNRLILPVGTISGGSVTYQAGTGDARLSALQATYDANSTFTITASIAQINLVSSSSVFSVSTAPLVIPGDSIWLGTFLVSSPVGWSCNVPTTPVWLPGTPCSILVFDSPPSTSASAICNSVSSGTLSNTSGNLQTGVVTTNNPSGLGRNPESILLSCLPTQITDPTGVVSDVQVFPNPASGKIYIRFAPDRNKKYSLRLVDILGNNLFAEAIAAAEGSNLREMNLSGMAKGVYFLRLEENGVDIQTRRIVVE